MNKREKQKWVKALRSNKFAQGYSQLYDKVTDTYCCLGVAGCVLGSPRYLKRIGSLPFLTDDRFGLSTQLQNALSLANDPGAKQIDLESAFERAGFATTPERTKHGDGISYYSTFNQIADWIEENL